MPTVLSKLADYFTSPYASSKVNVAQIRKLIEHVLKVYKNNRTLLGRTIWFVSVYLLYLRKIGSSKKRPAGIPTTEETARKKKRVEVAILKIDA